MDGINLVQSRSRCTLAAVSTLYYTYTMATGYSAEEHAAAVSFRNLDAKTKLTTQWAAVS